MAATKHQALGVQGFRAQLTRFRPPGSYLHTGGEKKWHWSIMRPGSAQDASPGLHLRQTQLSGSRSPHNPPSYISSYRRERDLLVYIAPRQTRSFLSPIEERKHMSVRGRAQKASCTSSADHGPDTGRARRRLRTDMTTTLLLGPDISLDVHRAKRFLPKTFCLRQ